MIVISFYSCKSSSSLQSEDFKLVKNIIDIESDDKVENKLVLKESLKLLYRQEQSKRVNFNPRTWFASKQVTVYDKDATEETAQTMQKYLRNKKGYYNAVVNYETSIVPDRQLSVRYLVNPKSQFIINSISYEGDQKIVKEIKNLKTNTKIAIGDPLDSEQFDLEKTRITNGLQNKGYANFVPNLIKIEGDSTNQKNAVDVTIRILDSPQTKEHKKYTVGNINIYTNHSVNSDTTRTLRKYRYDKKTFQSNTENFLVRPSALNKTIFLNEGEVYEKKNRIKTFRKLSRLSTYKYVYVQPESNSKIDTSINFNIFLTPQVNPWVVDFGSDLFYSTVSEIGRNLFGISGNTSLQHRNFLGGSERYTLDLEGTLEYDLNDLAPNTISFRVENSLQLPRHIDLFGLTKIMRTFRLISEKRVQSFKEESTTEIRLGYSFSKVIDFYTFKTLNLSWGYDYQPNNRSRYIIRQMGLNLLDTEIDTTSENSFLTDNKLLRNSFVDNLSTGLLFKDISYVYQGPKNRKGRSFGLLSSFEVSGLETFLLNKTSNLISGNQKLWSLGTINFAKYIKAEVDGRILKDLTQGSAVAARANFGIAVPYGRKEETVPYVVQFFSGGPNSIRAWQIRELGPGSRVIDPNDNEIFFQTGDIKLEFNLEYRTDLFWFIEGALFLDGGNLWTLKQDPDRPGSQFSKRFIDEMALGIGWGLRWDFTYFLIRADFGYKIRNSFEDPNSGAQWLFSKQSFTKYNGILGNINIAINYPF